MTEKAVDITSKYDTDDLRAISSFADAMALLQSSGVTVGSIEDYGDGFAMTDKDTLVKVPFVLISYSFHPGKYGPESEFVVARLVTEDGRKCIIVDGSTGIRDQCKTFDGKALLCPRGLTKSEYEYEDEKGNMIPATTFYIAG